MKINFIFSRLLICSICFIFLFNAAVPQILHAQVVLLPAPGSKVHFSDNYNPSVIKGMRLYPENPLQFDFIIEANESAKDSAIIREESQRLIGYFLTALTTPEQDNWVNLSPYEKDLIVPEIFGKTQMGQDLLAQDYLLKQIMATAMDPTEGIGKQFWQEVYKQAQMKFGTSNIKVNTFNKVWITPNKAEIYENAKTNSVFITQSTLKVMLEEDYLAKQKNNRLPGVRSAKQPCYQAGCQANEQSNVKATSVSGIQADMLRQIILPALEKEVNSGANFAPLRQVYQSLILAMWYKQNLKQSVLSKAYANRNRIGGLISQTPQENQKIYEQYLKAYRKGVVNLIQEEVDLKTKTTIPRSYFAGGWKSIRIDMSQTSTPPSLSKTAMIIRAGLVVIGMLSVPVDIEGVGIQQTAASEGPVDLYTEKMAKVALKKKKQGKILSAIEKEMLEDYGEPPIKGPQQSLVTQKEFDDYRRQKASARASRAPDVKPVPPQVNFPTVGENAQQPRVQGTRPDINSVYPYTQKRIDEILKKVSTSGLNSLDYYQRRTYEDYTQHGKKNLVSQERLKEIEDLARVNHYQYYIIKHPTLGEHVMLPYTRQLADIVSKGLATGQRPKEPYWIKRFELIAYDIQHQNRMHQVKDRDEELGALFYLFVQWRLNNPNDPLIKTKWYQEALENSSRPPELTPEGKRLQDEYEQMQRQRRGMLYDPKGEYKVDVAQTVTPGGIDLEKTDVRSRGDGVTIDFDNPEILVQLERSSGVVPVIYSMLPLTADLAQDLLR